MEFNKQADNAEHLHVVTYFISCGTTINGNLQPDLFQGVMEAYVINTF